MIAPRVNGLNVTILSNINKAEFAHKTTFAALDCYSNEIIHMATDNHEARRTGSDGYLGP